MPKLLVACEYSGVVREAFAKRGWDAWSCDLKPDEKELVSAEWFTRKELKAITPESDLQLPRKDSIARKLIDEWLDEN